MRLLRLQPDSMNRYEQYDSIASKKLVKKLVKKQRHLMKDILNKHRQNKFRRMQRNNSAKNRKRSKSQRRGKKRRISEM